MNFEEIKQFIAEEMSIDEDTITGESSFNDLGIDSLDTVELIMQLEDKLGVELKIEEKLENVGALVKFIQDKVQ
ncbi:MAG TPA: acyl carrier protein [Tissierellia bacterium]|nr:acyl carrier protein [Tissierellia bacterium]